MSHSYILPHEVKNPKENERVATPKDHKKKTKEKESDHEVFIKLFYGPDDYYATDSLSTRFCYKDAKKGVGAEASIDMFIRDFLHFKDDFLATERIKNHQNNYYISFTKKFGEQYRNFLRVKGCLERYGRTIFRSNTHLNAITAFPYSIQSSPFTIIQGAFSPYMKKSIEVSSLYNLACFGENLFLYTSCGLDHLQTIRKLNRDTFPHVTTGWLKGGLVYDSVRHEMIPVSGFLGNITLKTNIPHDPKKHSFIKLEGDAALYTPLARDNSLVLKTSSAAGIVGSYLRNSLIPRQELFYTPVARGFVWGNTGPVLYQERKSFSLFEPLGSKIYWRLSNELFFPLIPQKMSKKYNKKIRMSAFYDIGSSWQTQNKTAVSVIDLKRNKSHMYHSIGSSFNWFLSAGDVIHASVAVPLNKKYGSLEPNFTLKITTLW